MLHRRGLKFTTPACLFLQLRQCYLQFGITLADVQLPEKSVRSNWLCATFAESRPMLVLSSDESSSTKSVIFSQVLIKNYLQNSTYSHIPDGRRPDRYFVTSIFPLDEVNIINSLCYKA